MRLIVRINERVTRRKALWVIVYGAYRVALTSGDGDNAYKDPGQCGKIGVLARAL